jgi:PKD repeat protein
MTEASFTVSPDGDPISISTSYDTYTYAQTHHEVDVEYTFTGSFAGANPVEWHWDFGDGTEALGQVVTHTYTAGSPEIQCTLRVTDSAGKKTYAWVNMMMIVPVIDVAPHNYPSNLLYPSLTTYP